MAHPDEARPGGIRERLRTPLARGGKTFGPDHKVPIEAANDGDHADDFNLKSANLEPSIHPVRFPDKGGATEILGAPAW